MRWYESGLAPMSRIAVVAREARLRDALVRVADAGVVEFDRIVAVTDLPIGDAARGLQRISATGPVSPRLVVDPPDLAVLERAGRADLLAGEVALGECSAQAVVQDDIAALLGWAPTDSLPGLARELATVGAAAAPLPAPHGVQPPTAPRRGRMGVAFSPLVDTYGQVPYRDVDPAIASGLAYVIMFGAMFGDVGHGALLVVGALLIRIRRAAPPVAGPPAAARDAHRGRGCGRHGLRSGLRRMLRPDRDRRTGTRRADRATSAHARRWHRAGRSAARRRLRGRHRQPPPRGRCGVGAVRSRRHRRHRRVPERRDGNGRLVLASGWLGVLAALLAAVGLGLAFVGLRAEAGKGAAAITQAVVETFDLVLRLGANVVSFARLAAFGITHAVLGLIVWEATVGLWHHGPVGARGASHRIHSRQCIGIRPGGARRRDPGPAPGILRAVLPGFPGGGPPVPALARTDRNGTTPKRRHHVGLASRVSPSSV